MGHSQIMTTQKYLHTLPDADDRALAAFERVRARRRGSPQSRDTTRDGGASRAPQTRHNASGWPPSPTRIAK